MGTITHVIIAAMIQLLLCIIVLTRCASLTASSSVVFPPPFQDDESLSLRIPVYLDNATQGTWFAQPPTPQVLQRRVNDQYPFVSIDYYISKANTIIDFDDLRKDHMTISSLFRYQYDFNRKKPIIFLPSDYLFHFVRDLSQLTVTFSLITVSNQPICVPYITHPPLAEDIPRLNTTFNDIDALLASPYLDKWFTKNPCIKHPKIHPLPVGPKWQWSSQRFLDDDSEVSALSQIYRRYGLKPFAMAHNYSHLLYDTSHSVHLFQQQVVLDPDTLNTERIDNSMIRNADELSSFVQRHNNFIPPSWFLKMDTHMFPGKDRLLYFNFFANNTDKPLYRPHANIRRLAYDSLISQGFQPSPVRQINGYLQDLSEHKFCISPPGVGLDAHRTWEALMVGTIPIVLSSPMDPLYDDLPVVIVDSFEVVTKDSLEAVYESVRANAAGYDYSKLFVHYWDQVIV